MTRTLADLRTDPQPSRAERSQTVCTAPHLVAEVMALTAQLTALATEIATFPTPTPADVETDDENPSRPKRTGEGVDPQLAALRVREAETRALLGKRLEEMAEHEDEIRWRAIDDGDWRRWVNENPPRDEGRPGHQRDQEVTIGYCNADALIDDLGRYVATWNGEPLADGDWQIIAGKLGSPDKKKAASIVVSMHENGLDIPLWRSGLSATLRSANALAPHGPTAAPEASSTGESPQSVTSTTTPTASSPATPSSIVSPSSPTTTGPPPSPSSVTTPGSAPAASTSR